MSKHEKEALATWLVKQLGFSKPSNEFERGFYAGIKAAAEWIAEKPNE